MVTFAGWQMPLRYASETGEHHAVRRAAGLFDVSHMGEILVSGAGAGAALDYSLVGEMSGLSVGRARYSMICVPDGGVLDDLVVYHLDARRYLVIANASNTGPVLRALSERAEGFDAVVTDMTDAYALLALQGPRSAEILGGLVEEDLAGLRYYSFAQVLVADQPVLLARTGYTGEDGFELLVAPDLAEDVWGALLMTGEPLGLVPAGLACRDTLRLEAGMALHGNELHLGVTPYEAGLGRVVRLDKPGGFVGHDALAERATAGPVSQLVGLTAKGAGRVPRHGSSVLAAGSVPTPRPPRPGPGVVPGSNSGRSGPLLGPNLPELDRDLGIVTSGALSPTLGRRIAMASVPPGATQPGMTVGVDIRGHLEPFEVAALPFYRRER